MTLQEKILVYLAENGIEGAAIHDRMIVIPKQDGDFTKEITGFISTRKLDETIREYRQSAE